MPRTEMEVAKKSEKEGKIEKTLRDEAELYRLNDRVTLFIGGASTIGVATARLFFQHEATVIIADSKEPHHWRQYCADYLPCDVTKENELRNAVDFAWEKAKEKTKKFDIIFTSAEILDENKYVNGINNGLKRAAKVMKGEKMGCIISTAYMASKQKFIDLTKGAAVKHGKVGIRVNCVSSRGKVNVDSVPNNTANLTVNNIAEAVLFLASEEAKYVTGHDLVVDGGFKVDNHSWGLYCLK